MSWLHCDCCRQFPCAIVTAIKEMRMRKAEPMTVTKFRKLLEKEEKAGRGDYPLRLLNSDEGSPVVGIAVDEDCIFVIDKDKVGVLE